MSIYIPCLGDGIYKYLIHNVWFICKYFTLENGYRNLQFMWKLTCSYIDILFGKIWSADYSYKIFYPK